MLVVVRLSREDDPKKETNRGLETQAQVMSLGRSAVVIASSTLRNNLRSTTAQVFFKFNDWNIRTMGKNSSAKQVELSPGIFCNEVSHLSLT